MQQPDVFDAMSRGWDRMQEILFQGADWKRWAIMGTVAFLVQCGRGTGSVNLNIGDTSNFTGGGSPIPPEAWAFIGVIAIFILIVVMLVSLLGLFIGSHAEFSMVRKIVSADPEGSHLLFDPSWKAEGNSLFGLRLVLLIVSFLLFLVLGGVTLGVLYATGAFAGFSDLQSFSIESLNTTHFVIISISVMLSFVLMLILGFISFLINNYVVPLVYMRKYSAFDGWKEGVGLFTSFISSGLLLFGIRVCLNIALAIISFVVALLLMCACIGCIPFLNVWVVAVLTSPITVFMHASSLYFIESHFGNGTLFSNPMNFSGNTGFGSGLPNMPGGGAAAMYGSAGVAMAAGSGKAIYVQPTLEEYEAAQRMAMGQPQQTEQGPSYPEQPDPYAPPPSYAYGQGASTQDYDQRYAPPPPPTPGYVQEVPPPPPMEPYAQQDAAPESDSGYYPPPAPTSKLPEPYEDAYQPPPPPVDEEYDPDAARYGGGSYGDDRYAVEPEDAPPPPPPTDADPQDWRNYPPPPPPPVN
jgi:hypothetical protein